MTDNLRRLGNEIAVAIPTDLDGLTGRECPQPDCEGYFKVKFGTGLNEENVPCHCAYCGHVGSHDTFWTREQIEYAESVAIRKVMDAFVKDLEKSEFTIKPKGAFGIGMSLKVEGKSHPIRYYREKELETSVVCDKCTLEYAVYGVFAHCPDCGSHNSRLILSKTFDLAETELALAATVEKDLAAHLISDALENAVSAFDGFGRQVARRFAVKSKNASRAESLSFQNIGGAKKNCLDLFGINLGDGFDAAEWADIVKGFQKRHLIAHTMGVTDEQYVQATGDTTAIVGRKVSITSDEVRRLIALLRRLGEKLVSSLEALP